MFQALRPTTYTGGESKTAHYLKYEGRGLYGE